MKYCYKFIILITTFFLCLSSYAKPNYSYSTNNTQVQNNYQGTYVNEEIDVPITQIGLPQSYTQPQVQEKGLEIVWNQWHAKIRNKLSQDISRTLTPQNYIITVMCTIDKNQNISDIIVAYFPRTALKIISGVAYLKNQTPFYVYRHTQGIYYKATVNSDELFTLGKLGKDEHEEVSKIMKNAYFHQISYNQIPYYKFFRQIATKVENRQGEAILKFPQASKRNSVAVTGGVTDILSIQTVIQYTSDMFNDLERY